jgi:hypothetical protein
MPKTNIKPGDRFGKLTVIKDSGKRSKHGAVLFECKCDCGNTSYPQAGSLRFGRVKSCGCTNTTHGFSHKIPEYQIWCDMRRRCHDPKRTDYSRYGGRGIYVCDQWLGEEGFKNFLYDMGRKPFPKAQIDRIDNDGPYSLNNCRWTTPKINNRNRSNIRWFEYNGEKKLLQEWAEEVNIPYKTLVSRIYRNKWSIEKALTTPVKKFTKS